VLETHPQQHQVKVTTEVLETLLEMVVLLTLVLEVAVLELLELLV
jgi:hypothetical protein